MSDRHGQATRAVTAQSSLGRLDPPRTTRAIDAADAWAIAQEGMEFALVGQNSYVGLRTFNAADFIV